MDEKQQSAKHMAKRLSDYLIDEMIKELKASPFNDETAMFQAQVCHLISAFFLSTSIKILKINKLPKSIIDELCNNSIEIAHDFANRGKFSKFKEH